MDWRAEHVVDLDQQFILARHGATCLWKECKNHLSLRIENGIFSSLQTLFLGIVETSVSTVHHHETSFKGSRRERAAGQHYWSIFEPNHVVSAVNTKIEIKFEVCSDAAGEQDFALFYTHLKTYYTYWRTQQDFYSCVHWAALMICVVCSCEIWFQSCEASTDSSSSLSLNRTLETDFWGVGVLTGAADGNRNKYKQKLIFSWSHTELLMCPNRPGEMMSVNFGLCVFDSSITRSDKGTFAMAK